MDKAAKIEAYFEEEHPYKKAIGKLRELVLQTSLEETYKWMFPTYTLKNKNVLSLCKFKQHFGIWFFNGVFLSDPLNVLQNAQEGKTKAMRHWKFSSEDDIDPKLVLAYVYEAIENQENGRVLAPSKKSPQPAERSVMLEETLASNSKLNKAFSGLTAYKQKEFHEYIHTAKQEKTKIKRLEKIIPMIEAGIGLNDRYR